MYYFLSPLCSYQAVAYIEASAVIYQDGKVIVSLMSYIHFPFLESQFTGMKKCIPHDLRFMVLYKCITIAGWVMIKDHR
jgi:hypothetical protein